MSDRTYNIILAISDHYRLYYRRGIALRRLPGSGAAGRHADTDGDGRGPHLRKMTPGGASRRKGSCASVRRLITRLLLSAPPTLSWTDWISPLIEEIGRRLGVAVELNDIAFDGLSWALQLQPD